MEKENKIQEKMEKISRDMESLKMVERLEQTLPKEDIQMVKKHTKSCSTLLIPREMRMKVQ